jgi:hypothetical protein
MVEESLQRSQRTEAPLYVQVQQEAQQALSPEELALFKSAKAAMAEKRSHSLEEYAAMNQFQELKDVAARRHGFWSYGGVLHQYIVSQPKPKPSVKQSQEIVEILTWGRLNCAHRHQPGEDLEASESDSSASVIELDPGLGMARSTPVHYPNL